MRKKFKLTGRNGYFKTPLADIIQLAKDVNKELDRGLNCPERDYNEIDIKPIVVLLSGILNTPNPPYIAAFTGYSLEYVGEIAENLRKSGVWKDKTTYCEWFLDKEYKYKKIENKKHFLALFSLGIDSMVATGEIKRKNTFRKGRLRGVYSIADHLKRNNTVQNDTKLHRNQLCSCGSDKKFKKCCLK